jgi:hypothetical protein
VPLDHLATLGKKNADATSTRTKVTHVESGGNGIIGCVSSVVYGEWEEAKALLVSLDFSFRSRRDSGRIESIEIVASFEPDKNTSSTLAREQPRVRAFFPTKTSSDALRGPPGTPPFTVKGQAWSRKKREDPHQVIWTIVSHGGTGDGLNGCVSLCSVVTATGPLTAMVTAKGKLHNPFAGFLPFRVAPWTKDDPVLFDFKTEKGKLDICRQFHALDEITYMDWASNKPTSSNSSTTTIAAPAAVSKPPASNTGSAYRVRGIPMCWTESHLVAILAKELDLDPADDPIELRSFSPSPFPHRSESAAVVSFVGKIPMLLTAGQDKWEIKVLQGIHDTPTCDTHSEVAILIIDSSFKGFSSLGSYTLASRCLETGVEYAKRMKLK